jgi:ABC-2 type transport system ATP-binding protein
VSDRAEPEDRGHHTDHGGPPGVGCDQVLWQANRARRLAPRRQPDRTGRLAAVAVIELHDLTKRFGELVAVDHLSFEVESGRVVGFLGPNGAGKTTTLRMLLGLATPTGGSATINGRPYQQLDQPLHIVGAVLDASDAHPGRTARNHLRIQAMLGEVSPSRIDEVLNLVDLTSAAGRRVGEFSLGMRQRLGLATAC